MQEIINWKSSDMQDLCDWIIGLFHILQYDLFILTKKSNNLKWKVKYLQKIFFYRSWDSQKFKWLFL